MVIATSRYADGDGEDHVNYDGSRSSRVSSDQASDALGADEEVATSLYHGDRTGGGGSTRVGCGSTPSEDSCYYGIGMRMRRETVLLGLFLLVATLLFVRNELQTRTLGSDGHSRLGDGRLFTDGQTSSDSNSSRVVEYAVVSLITTDDFLQAARVLGASIRSVGLTRQDSSNEVVVIDTVMLVGAGVSTRTKWILSREGWKLVEVPFIENPFAHDAGK